jgi:hypothetical protein
MQSVTGFINVFAVGDFDHDDYKGFILDLIQNAIVLSWAGLDPENVLTAAKLDKPMRSRVLRKLFDI